MDYFRPKIAALRDALLAFRPLRTRSRLRIAGVIGCGLLGILCAWLGMQFQGEPEPSLPIEQANLLAAETFASGRLANPVNTAGFFLQTYLTLQSPAYVAAVPPGAGLLLAIGVLLGDPVYGLWLTVGLFVAATTWMLLGFASLRWAVLGGVLAALWFGSLTFWAQSFASPAATGLGAALLWGATRRFGASRRARDAGLIGAGAGWLVLCHPVAAAFALPVPGILVIKTLWREKCLRKTGFLSLGVVVALGFQAALNHAATGKIGTSAPEAYEQRYNVHPKFLWERPKVPGHFDFWRMEQYDLLVHEAASGWTAPVGATWLKRLDEQAFFYLGLPGAILLAGGFLLGATTWARILVWAVVTSSAVFFLAPPLTMGMTAPLAPLTIALIVWATRRIWTLRTKRSQDCWSLTGLFLAAFAVIAIHRGFAFPVNQELAEHRTHRSSLTRYLKEKSGSDLVIVSYAPETNIQVEYVYNGADPDTQDIVWARGHDTADLSPLFRHYKNRNFWSLTVLPKGEPSLVPIKWEEKSTSSTVAEPAVR